jgi:transcriptional regulator with XRE-family HTH domain
MSNFNVNLKKIREKKGLTAKEVAIDLGIPYTTYLKYEGVGEPRYDTLIKIADYLNVSIDELLGYTPNEYEKTKEFLADYNIIVRENEDTTIQVIYPINKNPLLDDDLLRSAFFATKDEFIYFINNASQEIIENNIVDYIVDYVVKTDRKIYEEFARQCELYIKENPNDKKFIEFYERTKPISLGLKFPEANKKNPPPSEVGEGLKG